MKYNYLEAMVLDILEYISENYTEEETRENFATRANRDKWAGELNDDLWAHDSVTGNASGSYTFNSYRAKEYVTENGDLLREAMRATSRLAK